MPTVELTNQVVGAFGLVVLVATSIWLALAVVGFLTSAKNRKAQGLDQS